MLTKATLMAMSEAELRSDVLVPLFMAMKFNDVTIHHSSTELGKDIVMWKHDEVMARVNYAVVAKRGPITGSASGGRDSAATTTFQVQQCFGATYADPTTGLHQAISQCWVVASGTIKEATIQAISAALGAGIPRHSIRFIDGDRLWELIERHMAQMTALSHAERIRQLLRDAHEHHGIAISIAGEDITLAVMPKYPGAFDREPPRGRVTFQFPDSTTEGREMAAAFDRHERTGAPLVIPQQFIVNLELPDVLRQILGPGGQIQELQVGPRRTNAQIDLELEMKGQNGESVTVHPLRFQVVQAGTEQITISTLDRASGWDMRIVFDHNSRTGRFDIRTTLANVNVRQQLTGVRFFTVASAGGELIVRDARSGLVAFRGRLAAGLIEPAPEEFIHLLERLLVIQERTGIALSFPDRELTAEEVQHVEWTSRAVEEAVTEKHWKTVSFEAPRDTAANLISVFVGGRYETVTHERSVRSNIFGADIDLGFEQIVLPSCTMTKRDLSALRRALTDAKGQEFFTIRLTAKKGSRAITRYTRRSIGIVAKPLTSVAEGESEA